MKKKVSALLKLIAAGSSLGGVGIVMFVYTSSFMGGLRSLMYFTILSNILLGVVELLALLSAGNESLQRKAGLWLYWSVVSITLTFMVFVTMLAPFMSSAWSLPNVLTHLVAPIAAIVDYLFFDEGFFPEKKHIPGTVIPPYLYLIFTIIAYNCKWEFSHGRYYPYNFVNYGGSAGVFGFSTDVSDSLFLGSFYWVVILTLFVLGIAKLFRHFHNTEKTRNSC